MTRNFWVFLLTCLISMASFAQGLPSGVAAADALFEEMTDSFIYVKKSSIKTGSTGNYATIVFDVVYNAKAAEQHEGFKFLSATGKVKAYCSDGSGRATDYVLYAQHNLAGNSKPVDWNIKIDSFDKPPAGLSVNVYKAVCAYAVKNGIYQDSNYVSPEEKAEMNRIDQQNKRFCVLNDSIRIYDNVLHKIANTFGIDPRSISFQAMNWDERRKSCYTTIYLPVGVSTCETWIDSKQYIFRLDCGSHQFCSGSCNANGR